VARLVRNFPAIANQQFFRIRSSGMSAGALSRAGQGGQGGAGSWFGRAGPGGAGPGRQRQGPFFEGPLVTTLNPRP
jgi:hypothetical protein